MNSDTRNARVLALLIGAMTIGAATLLGIEPRSVRVVTPPLTAELEGAIEHIELTYVSPRSSVRAEDFNCLVFPDRRPDWRPDGPDLRVAVIGGDADRLPLEQQRQLLVILSGLNGAGVDVQRVEIDPNSDPRRHPNLPHAAHELVTLLERKGLLN